MEDGDKANLGSKMPRIGADPAQRLGGDLEQDGVDPRLILECKSRQRARAA